LRFTQTSKEPAGRLRRCSNSRRASRTFQSWFAREWIGAAENFHTRVSSDGWRPSMNGC